MIGNSNEAGAENSKLGGGFIERLGAADSTGCLGALSKQGLGKGPAEINSQSPSESDLPVIANIYVDSNCDPCGTVYVYRTTYHTNDTVPHSSDTEAEVAMDSQLSEGPTK